MNNILLLFILEATFFTASKSELQLVNVIFRHGDRTPSKKATFPTDPNFEYDFHPMGYGQLTNAGKLRSYELGEFLRKRYDEFLGDVYFPNLVYARSSDVDRTKMTMQLVLAALFPPPEEQKWNKNLDWQPIPYSYESLKQDYVLAMSHQPAFYLEEQRVRMSKEVQNRLNTYADFMSELTNLTGKQMTKPADVRKIYNTLYFEKNLNLTLPDWSEGLFPEGKLLEITLLDCEIMYYDRNITRLVNGELMSKLTSDMLSVKKNRGIGKRDTRMYLYSAHDMNVYGFLRALNLYHSHIPYFNSAVIIELHKNDNDYFVKMLYYHGNTTEVEELKLPGCTELCPIEKYLNSVNYLLN